MKLKSIQEFKSLEIRQHFLSSVLGGFAETCYERRCGTSSDTCDLGDVEVYESDDHGYEHTYIIDFC